MGQMKLLPSAFANFGKPAARVILLLSVMLMSLAQADSVRGSKHDLSTNYDPISAQVCMYCHTPHHANNTLGGIRAPLWNRVIDTTKVFTVYTSPSLVNTAGNPNTSVSVLCLGCHDGTVSSGTAYGITFSDKHEVINGASLGEKGEYPNCDSCHQNIGGSEKWWVGQNLSNMHPITIPYPTSAKSTHYNQPPDQTNGWPDLKLFNGKVECATCHKVHDPALKPFLRKSNSGSALCLTCHIK